MSNTYSVGVSVIIPVYGVEPYIERCVRSLFEQTMLENIEYIFVNDCTQDKSMEILSRIIREYPTRKDQIRIINHNQNKGLCMARQTGIYYSRGEYIAHCDSDDWVEPKMYQSLYTIGKQDNADIVSCNFVLETNKGAKYISFKYNNREQYLRDAISGNWGTVWKFMTKRQLLINGDIYFNKKICHGEDYIYTAQCLLAAKRITNIDRYYYHYNCCNMSSMMNKQSLDSAYQQYAASEFIFKILEEKKISFSFSKEILLRKLYTRNRFLPFGVNKWRQIYPEIKNKYWKLPEIPFLTKIAYYILEHIPLIKVANKIMSR